LLIIIIGIPNILDILAV